MVAVADGEPGLPQGQGNGSTEQRSTTKPIIEGVQGGGEVEETVTALKNPGKQKNEEVKFSGAAVVSGWRGVVPVCVVRPEKQQGRQLQTSLRFLSDCILLGCTEKPINLSAFIFRPCQVWHLVRLLH